MLYLCNRIKNRIAYDKKLTRDIKEEYALYLWCDFVCILKLRH